MKTQLNIQLSDLPSERIALVAIDCSTGEILAEIHTKREYRYRKDIIAKSCDFLAKEILFRQERQSVTPSSMGLKL